MTCKLVNICLINRCVTLFWICCWWSKMKLCEGSPPSTKWEFWHYFIYKFAAILMICRSASGSPHIVRRPKYSALHYLGSRLASAGRRGLRSLRVIRGCDEMPRPGQERRLILRVFILTAPLQSPAARARTNLNTYIFTRASDIRAAESRGAWHHIKC